MPDIAVRVVDRRNIDYRDVDGVIIATPSATHFDIALPYIERGIPTFIEKPMVTSMEHFRLLKKIASEKNAPVFVGYITLFNPYIAEIKKRIPGIKKLHLKGTSQTFRSDSSVLWDWLPHDLVIMKALFGEFPRFIFGRGYKKDGLIVKATLKFKSKSADIYSSVSWSTQSERSFFVTNAQNSILFDDKKKLLLYNGEKQDFDHRVDLEKEPLLSELEEFVEMTRNYIFSTKYLEMTEWITSIVETIENNIDTIEL